VHFVGFHYKSILAFKLLTFIYASLGEYNIKLGFGRDEFTTDVKSFVLKHPVCVCVCVCVCV